MNVLISGSSIAGPALAFWLHRLGATVTVVERAPALRPGGYAVDVRGAALDVLDRMGLRDCVRPFETDTLSNAVVDASGRIYGRLPRGFGVIGADDVEIHRGDLARILYDATSTSAGYRFGDSIAFLHSAGPRVAVEFESGKTQDFDLVVGADGVHSRTRALAFGEESGFVREMGSCMAIFTVPNHLGLYRQQLLFAGVGRIASIKTTNESRDLSVCVFYRTPPVTFDHCDVAAQREQVASAFADAGWEFPRLMAGMRAADDFYADLTCQVRMSSYVTGRVALVGDAAYCPSPLSGQGTSLALVGAYVLASALRDGCHDVASALTRYDAQMRPFVSKNQDVAWKLAKNFAPRTPFQVWARNAGMRVFSFLPAKNVLMKLALREVRDASQAIALPQGLAL